MVNEQVLWYLVLVLFAFCVIDTEAGKFCHKRQNYFYKSSTYCTYGCCGSWNNEYCCGAGVALIAGCIFAGILGVAIIVAIVCCCIKKQTHAGRVVQPSRPGPDITVVYSGMSGQYPSAPPYYGGPPAQPMAPPAYKQFENTPPPAYTYSNPAYPPTPVPPPVPPATPAAPPAPDAPPPTGFNLPATGGITSTAPPSTNLTK